MKIKLQDYGLISIEWIDEEIERLRLEYKSQDNIGRKIISHTLLAFRVVRQKLIPSEKLGEEINKVDNEKWYKVFAPKCRNEVGITVRYEIIYIRGDELSEIRDYEILKEYSNKLALIEELNIKK
jgi:hypothetical protein